MTGRFQHANPRAATAATTRAETPRRRRARALAIVGALPVAAACGGPLGPFAGGELSGDVAEPPAQWGAVPDAIQMEVRPPQPYSVNLWSVALGPHLYVATGREDSAWKEHLAVDNNVRVRVAATVYELQAVVVGDRGERRRVVDAYMRKYASAAEDSGGFAPIRKRRQRAMRGALDEKSGLIYRLAPRQPP